MQNTHLLSSLDYYSQLMREIEQEPAPAEMKTVRVEGNYGNESGYNTMASSSSTTYSVVGVTASALVN